jgi:hypothetical protein
VLRSVLRLRSVVICSALFIPSPSKGQEYASAPPARNVPKSAIRTQARVQAPPSARDRMSAPPEIQLGAVAETQIVISESPARQVGIVRELESELSIPPACEQTGDRTLMRIAFRSQGAAAIRVHFDKFEVGESKVWLHSGAAESPLDGPYTERGPNDTGDFWSGTIFGDVIVIEYEAPSTLGCGSSIPFVISELAHLWEAPLVQRDFPQPVSNLFASPSGPASSIDQPSAAAYCHLNSADYAQYSDTASSVAQFNYVSNGASFVCSGSLINTRPYTGKPYFLTANHCIKNQAEALTMDVYWFYDHWYDPKFLLYRSRGKTFLTGQDLTAGDFALVELDSIAHVPNLWFAGWTAEEPLTGELLTGIHHPDGSYKRISFGQRIPSIDTNVEGQLAPASKFFRVSWTEGLTEGGSSGSPLFIYRNGWIVTGALSYGLKSQSTACLFPRESTYGRFSTAYPSLKLFLDSQSCNYSLSSYSNSLNYIGGSGVVTVGTGGTCPRSAVSDVPWITITSPSGVGNGIVSYLV